MTRDECAAWDKEHPDAYEIFRRIARTWYESKAKRASARWIVGWIRWRTHVGSWREHEYKINDHMSTYYARKFMDEFPECEGFFQLRDNAEAKAKTRTPRPFALTSQ